LYSLIYTFIPVNIFLYSFLFISHKIIERKESKYISHYKIVESLGSGGLGHVYKALDINTSFIVAIKILKPEIVSDTKNRDMILNEGKTLLSLNHPNIIKVFEIGSGDEHTFIAMEYLPGETLQKFVELNYPLQLNTFIGIALDICRGLSAVHECNLIHRDLKSQNIMFDKNNRIKILDFGLSKNPVYVTKTTGHGGIGTLGFMAPEQVTSSNIDHRADIFSLGIIMYYMATNSVPFSGENEIALIHSIFNKEPKAPSEINSMIPNSIDSIIFKCLEKSVTARYNNVKEIISDLENIQKQDEGR
jgi:serine/threonine-protein kinase